ncbi:MAG: flagellar basal body L-ring protein FlgH [Burkholderiaceae bacterium]
MTHAVLTIDRVRLARCGALALMVLVLSGCAALNLNTPSVDVQPPPPRMPSVARVPQPSSAAAALPVSPRPVVAAPASAGAIFQGQSYRPLFETVRARTVGDVLTVSIEENTTARQSSNTSINRGSKLDGSISAIPFVRPGSTPLARAKIGAGLDNDTASKGESGSDNVFKGTITATVAEVLANGHLVVVGEKQVGVNQTVDSLRFSGVVDPMLIRPGNTINSTQVADVRLEFRGRGDIDRAMTTGWLQRFFFSYAPL